MHKEGDLLVVDTWTGREERFSYDEASAKRPEWLSQYENRERYRFYCLCRGHERIRLHLVKREHWHLASNPGQARLHAPHCGFYRNGVVRIVERRKKQFGIETVETVNEKGERVASLIFHVDDFFSADQEQTEEHEPPTPNMSSAAETECTILPEKRIIVRGERKVRGKLTFSGFLREWYRVGLQWYEHHQQHKAKNVSELLYGMWRVMLDGTITFHDGKDPRALLFIPNRYVEPWHGERQKIVVGQLGDRSRSGSGEFWRVDGIYAKGTSVRANWNVLVREVHLCPNPHIGALVALRVKHEADQLMSVCPAKQALIVERDGCAWVDSLVEYQFHEILMNGLQRRPDVTVEKPLEGLAEYDGRRPDYVLRMEGKPPLIIEIWGMSGKTDYDESKEKRRAFYRQLEKRGELRFLEWDSRNPRERAAVLRDIGSWMKK
ncbi:hypothetical protein C7445_1393 [Alicyclobacillus sacchari]|uniref:Uncharacterized protein n=2 Tax=Alicyclobacillus sacchari TaxID=392010 RepID=A0A4R8L6B5_9BACL|nr:hypothetical protein [Alicyclobacillus sacchari]TDY38196.1 hypothetical protein C7445_1393 [Alicyclobacillus sacchari]